MRDSALTAPRIGLAALPAVLDRAAFTLLLILGVPFAIEFRHPILIIGGLKLTNIEALMALIFAAWLGSRLLAARLPRVPKIIVIPTVTWLAILILSTLFAPAYQHQAILFMGRTLTGLLIGWAAFDLTQTRLSEPHSSTDRTRTLMLALSIGGTIVAIIGLMEATQLAAILRWLLNFKAAPTQIGDVTRISSTLSYATIAAMVLELTLPLMLALWLTESRRWLRIVLTLAIILTLATLVLTLSRAGVLSLGAALAMLILYGISRRSPTLIRAGSLTAALLTLFVIAVMLWNPVTALRLSTETEESWYRATYDVPPTVEMRPRQIIEVPVTVTNTSVRAWQASSDKPYMLSYHLVDEHGTSITYDGARTYLPHDIQPDESITLQALIAAPEQAGTYRLEWDMVQDSVSWFSWKGTSIAQTELIVSGTPVEGQAISRTARPTEIRVVTPAPTRFELWGAALHMALDYPFLGVGPDNFRWQYGVYANLDEWNTDIHANNLYLEWLADSGFLGLAAFLWLSASLLIAAFRATWRSGSLLLLGLLASLIAWYVHGFFDSFIEFTPTYVAFWLIAGLTLSLVSGAPRDAHRV